MARLKFDYEVTHADGTVDRWHTYAETVGQAERFLKSWVFFHNWQDRTDEDTGQPFQLDDLEAISESDSPSVTLFTMPFDEDRSVTADLLGIAPDARFTGGAS